MEKHYFWAFFIIALIAGASIAISVSTMTGNAIKWPWTQAKSNYSNYTQGNYSNYTSPGNYSNYTKPSNVTNCSNCTHVLDMLNKCKLVGDSNAGNIGHPSCNDLCKTKVGKMCILGLYNYQVARALPDTTQYLEQETIFASCDSIFGASPYMTELECVCCSP